MATVIMQGSVFEGEARGYLFFFLSILSLFVFVPFYRWLMEDVFKRKNFDGMEAMFPWVIISMVSFVFLMGRG